MINRKFKKERKKKRKKRKGKKEKINVNRLQDSSTWGTKYMIKI